MLHTHRQYVIREWQKTNKYMNGFFFFNIIIKAVLIRGSRVDDDVHRRSSHRISRSLDKRWKPYAPPPRHRDDRSDARRVIIINNNNTSVKDSQRTVRDERTLRPTNGRDGLFSTFVRRTVTRTSLRNRFVLRLDAIAFVSGGFRPDR